MLGKWKELDGVQTFDKIYKLLFSLLLAPSFGAIFVQAGLRSILSHGIPQLGSHYIQYQHPTYLPPASKTGHSQVCCLFPQGPTQFLTSVAVQEEWRLDMGNGSFYIFVSSVLADVLVALGLEILSKFKKRLPSILYVQIY